MTCESARRRTHLCRRPCRLAFHGRLCLGLGAGQQLHDVLRVYKLKGREGVVERVEPDGCTAVCRGMFKKESDMTAFQGESLLCSLLARSGRSSPAQQFRSTPACRPPGRQLRGSTSPWQHQACLSVPGAALGGRWPTGLS